MAKLLRDHLKAVAADQETREERMAAEISDEKWNLILDHDKALEEAVFFLEGAKVDVNKWRLLRRRRERLFAERIEGAITGLTMMTKSGT